MKVKFTAILIIICLSNILHGQDTMKNYGLLINEAEHFFNNEEYEKSAKKYKQAFDVFGGKGGLDDRYNAAKSYAMSGDVDVSFFHLFKLAKATEHYGISNILKVEDDSNFKALYKDKRWIELLNIVNANKEELEANLDFELVKVLDKIFEDDQKYRKNYIDLLTEKGEDHKDSKASFEQMKNIDSINLMKVEKIINNRGWLGADIIGDKGVTTMFLVIQHADAKTQNKYLPIVRKAFREGKVEANLFAYLEDRVAVGKGEKQVYGTQVGTNVKTNTMYVLPLIDPINVDKRREEVGLQPLKEYLLNFNINWNVKEYIENLSKTQKQGEKHKY